MADDLTRNRIKVHQTLHGYREGHRLIAGSAKLPQPDARTMLVLSDGSGSGVRIPAEGYVTGYPLTGAGKYVLARTWAAAEMSRPGCVWTHSLLIDFADLASLVSANELVDRFKRPSEGAGSSFIAPLDITVERSPSRILAADRVRVAQWIEGIYGKPRSRIVADREDAADDKLVIAVWMQQWPRLRRAFRFCTLAGDDRSTIADVFDLQLIDGARSSHRSRIADAVFAPSIKAGERIEPLLEDLEFPGQSELRTFLRDVGGDVTDGRAAMIPLIHLYSALDPKAGSERISEAVAELEELGQSQGMMGRAAVAKLIFSRSDVIDKQLFAFAIDQVRSAPDLMGIEAAIVGRALLKWNPDGLGEALLGQDSLRLALDAVLPVVSIEELASAIPENPDALVALVSIRPDLLASPMVWKLPSADAPQLLKAANFKIDQAAPVVSAMITAGRDDCADAVVSLFGVLPIVRALSDRGRAKIPQPWLRAIAARTKELAACMADGTMQDRRILISLSQLIDPDALPQSAGQDPWVTAVENSTAIADEGGENLLAAYLFCRAMGARSKSPGRLLFLSVQRLHEACAVDGVSNGAWQLVERRLPWVSPWREWDRCERIRRAVVDQFLNRDLPPIEFGTVVDDGKLWSKLVNIAADSFRGRRYLDRVRKSLRDGSVGWWRERSRVLERKIR